MDQIDWARFGPDELPTQTLRYNLRFFDSVGSTNDLLKDAARAGEAESTVFVTDEQIAGRGRRGRSWTAPHGSSLLCSVLLRPHWLPPADTFYITILAAVATAHAIEATTGLPIQLKWPNDLQLRGRKLGGILVETELHASALGWAVIGCGINVNWSPSSVPELAEHATSISDVLGNPIDRHNLLRAWLLSIDQHYDQLRSGARSALFTAWRERLHTLGQPIRAETPQGALYGIAEDVAPDGALLVRDEHGQQHTVTAGDVSIRPQ